MAETEAQGRPQRWWNNRDVRVIAVLWAVFTVLGAIFALIVPDNLMGQPASNTMTEVERTFTVF